MGLAGKSVAAGAVAVVGLSACGGPTVQTGQSGVSYTCCRASDVNHVYRPGEPLRVHWIVHYPSASARHRRPGPATTTLTARLEGPFRTVEALKAAGHAPAPAVAKPLRVPSTGRAGSPVSRLRVPPSATGGYYDLVTEVRGAGGDLSGGASIIRVAG